MDRGEEQRTFTVKDREIKYVVPEKSEHIVKGGDSNAVNERENG